VNSPLPYHEKALLLQVAKGDERAFHVLFDTYRDRLYFYVLQIQDSKEIAEDIVQDTFLRIWLRRDQLPAIEHFNAYIFRMAQNAVMTGLRRKALETTILQEKMAPVTTEAGVDDQLHFKLVKDVIQKAVSTLPEQQKKVYLLRREEGRRIREIAQALNISEITVKRHLNRAQKALRQAIEINFPYESGILLIIFGLLVP
jgi:RNA polymerase sigma-70 factor (ECF subfamily)